MRSDCNIYFFFEKQAFNGLLKVIGIQSKYYDVSAGLSVSTEAFEVDLWDEV